MKLSKVLLLLFLLPAMPQVWAVCEKPVSREDYYLEKNGYDGGNVNVTGSATLDNNAYLAGWLCAGGKVLLNQDAQVAMDLSSESSVELGQNAKINSGQISASGQVLLGEDAQVANGITSKISVELGENAQVYNGAISATDRVTLGKGAQVKAGITSEGSVELGENAQVYDGAISATDKVTLGKGAKVKVGIISEGSVELGENAQVYDGAISAMGKVTLGKNVNIKAGITSKGSVELGENAQVYEGSIISGGSITLQNNTYVKGNVTAKGCVYYGDDKSSVEVGGEITEGEDCAVPPSADYYFEIETLANALTCEPHAVQVSVKNSADHSARSDYSGTISLSSAPSLGTWLLTGGSGQFNDNGSGSASYQFAQSDGGIADFALFNPVASSLTVAVSDGSASATSGLISFRPYQLKGELSCVQTLNGHCLTTANKPFQLTLTAVGKHNVSEACEVIQEYSGEKNITFWSSYLNPSDPVGLQVEVQAFEGDWVTIAGNAAQAVAQPVTFTEGVATVALNYPDTGKIQVHVRDDAGIGSPPSDPGQSDELQGSATTVVNPLQLVISKVSGNKREDSTAVESSVSNPATTTEGNGFIRASVPDYSQLTVDTFDVTVQAVKYCADTTTSAHCSSSYGKKTPSFRQDIRLNGSLFFPSSNSVASGKIHAKDGLTLPLTSTDQGEITYADLAFDDVGTLGFYVLSSDYLGVGDNDISSEKDSNDDYIVTQVGRFYPAYIAYGDHSFDAGCGEFTYMTAGSETDNPLAGSAVTLNYVLQAKAQVSSGAVEKTTVNYDAGLNYPIAPSTSFSHSAASLGNDVDLSSRLLPTSYYDAAQWQSGIYSVNALAMGLQKSSNGADGPYFAVMPKEEVTNKQLQYYIQLTGLDGEMLQGSVTSSCAEGSCRLPEDESESSLGDFAHGRLQAGNGHGSELQPIRTLIAATYFNGSEFVPLTADSCTPLLDEQLSANPGIDENRNIAIGNGSTSITILNSPLNSGKGYLQFSAPSSRGTFAYFLRLKGRVDNSLYSPWLLDKENAISCPDEVSATDKCISGNLQFGLFRGNDRIIYRRQSAD